MLEKFGESKDPLDDAMQAPEEDLLAQAMYTFLVQYSGAYCECGRSGTAHSKWI